MLTRKTLSFITTAIAPGEVRELLLDPITHDFAAERIYVPTARARKRLSIVEIFGARCDIATLEVTPSAGMGKRLQAPVLSQGARPSMKVQNGSSKPLDFHAAVTGLAAEPRIGSQRGDQT